jgi:catechol 2,3-dioxygenase-like lactoylglutathione lyase family enzyme
VPYALERRLLAEGFEMAKVLRSFVCLLSDKLAESRDFYVELFGWRVDYDSDWFVHLQAADSTSVELGILRRDHELVHETLRNLPPGVLLTIVVPDVDAVHRLVLERGLDLVEAPRNLFYGQRRMLLRDPNGALLDVSSSCEPSKEFLSSLGN